MPRSRAPSGRGTNSFKRKRQTVRFDHLNYTYQDGEGGIANALALAGHFADHQKICVVLSDNIIEGDIREAPVRKLVGCDSP